MMSGLAISPRGRLHLVSEDCADVNAGDLAYAIVSAFETSQAHGMLALAGAEGFKDLPPAFEFVRSVTHHYFTALCRIVANETGGSIDRVELPHELTQKLYAQAPPMAGLEYLSPEMIADWCRSLDAMVRNEIDDHPQGVSGFLHDHFPHWRQVGRVTFHLAENKRDAQRPFAFLATFANGLNAQGKLRHEPLGNALKASAGMGDRKAMLNLLMPVSRAAESVSWVKRLVDTGEIYRPLAWTPLESFEFLKSVPQLEAAGLTVRVPDWWNPVRPARPIVNVRVDSREASCVGVDAVLDFSVELSLDGESLTPEEIKCLLESAGGLVPLKGKWVELDTDKLNQALAHWRQVEISVREKGISFFEGMRLLAGADEFRTDAAAPADLPLREWTGLKAGPALSETLARLRSPDSLAESAPPGLKANLRPYQAAGFGWLRFVTALGLGACLADDMGLGKTVQVIALLVDHAREKAMKPSLLVVPASLISNWKAELRKFAPEIRFAVFHPSAAGEFPIPFESAEADAFDLIITTYGMVARTDWIRQHRWRLAILDEAQAIKNSGTRQTKAIKQLRSDSRIAMTGTPVENRLSDLWSLFDYLNPGLLGNPKQFASFVQRMQSPPATSFEPLRKLVGPYILRRLKTDKRVIADLPDKTEVEAWCPLSKIQAALYRKVVDDLASQLENADDDIRRRGLVLSHLMRLKQICNHPDMVTGSGQFLPESSGKFRRLGEIAEEIAARQEKVLVFTQFRELTETLAAYLSTIFRGTGLVLHGGTAVKKRQELVDRFQADDGPSFFVLSLKAGGTGLNLTAASHVVHFDRWWNPAIENQATDRAFRIGQKNKVLVHKFVCQGTIEERIHEMLADKTRIAADVIEAGNTAESLLTEMDDATLLKLICLDLSKAQGE